MGNKRVLWAGRFKEIASDRTLAYTSSLAVDSRLAWYDAVGSIAHARMLGRKGILPKGDVDKIVGGLVRIAKEALSEELPFSDKLEDVHTSIEFLLTERIGEAGAKLHTARSRNDQVATDFRMYLRDATLDAVELVGGLQQALLKKAKEHTGTIMPGFTHMQHAQPVSLAQHLMAHLQRVQRDSERLLGSYGRLNFCPLGSAALAGTTYPIDRKWVAEALGFDAPTENSMDSVSDRDFAAELLFCLSMISIHLSSLCEELVIWSTPEFGFVEISDAYSTGSSIMPQKKNPDVAELMRGRAARSIGDLASMLALLKSLPQAYNRDLQEDKSVAMAALDQTLASLAIAADMVETLRFDAERMKQACETGYLNATELADYLVRKGVAFRTAHEITGKVVRRAIEKGVKLEELPLSELRKSSKLIEADVFEALSLRNCVEKRSSYGGTSSKAVTVQLTNAEERLAEDFASVKCERMRLARKYRALLG
ncbi:MAG TPA: argininosuccinate lyase [Methanomassiliicoccales archaeon]|nr:argininosuccinate lyase [Methanomassiliicoccales archaeon]